MKAIILAAGYATRLYPLTINTPKALLPINGKPIINYIIEQIETLDDIDEIVVVSNHKFAPNVEKWALESNFSKPVCVLDDNTVSEETRLGAIGDIRFAINKKNINSDIVIIAGDNLFTFSLKKYYEFFVEKQTDCVCVKPFDDVELLKQYGVAEVDKNGRLIDVEEKPENPKSNFAVFATYMYKKDTIPLFDEYINSGGNPDAPGYFVEWLCKRKEIHAFMFEEECYDIGTPKSLQMVSEIFADKQI
ncbi:MAG: nucleotidyltransferase family protein [Firmicutes bacterium]|nr:nucleotidyltransferase family protein [Bacillota bacterium]